MNREARDLNEAVSANSHDVQRLRLAFPEYFDADGNFMLDRFEAMLKGDEVTITREGYELKFLGKSYAKFQTSTDTETVLVPDLAHNAQPKNADSENLYIVGDNLDALKHMVRSYSGAVKCIYIDPPYNTGSDGFVYNDDFGFTASQLVEKIGISEEEAQRTLDMRGKSSHSAWLTFMYPRLMLAKELLADDGAIFISIDDNEQANLKLLCDDIFGEQNHVASIVVKNNPRGRQSTTSVAPVHEYVICYCKDSTKAELNGKPLTEQQRAEFDFEDQKGKYRLLGLRQRGAASLREDRSDMYFPVYVDPVSESVSLERRDGWQVVLPKKSDGRDGRWMWGQEKCTVDHDRLVAKLISTRNEYDIFVKDYLTLDDGNERTRKVLTVWDETSMNQQVGTQEVKKLLGADAASFPKPSPLMIQILQMGMNEDGLIVDFFSGSGTTADAVMQLNAADNGSRRYIMVQIPESIGNDNVVSRTGFKTIDEIGRKRIMRASEKIKAETSADIDYGFNLVRLESPLKKTIDDLESFSANTDANLLSTGDLTEKFAFGDIPGVETILKTWLNQDGYGLTARVETAFLATYDLRFFKDSAYVVAPGIMSEDVVALVSKVESGELSISRVVVFPYSVTFGVMHELKKNLSVLKSGRTVTVIERF